MPGAPWGGSEELWSQAALRLHQAGHEVSASVVWWPQLSPKVTLLVEQGVKLYTRKPQVRPSLAVRAWRRIQKRSGQTPDDFAWLARQKPDLAIIAQGGIGDGLDWMNFCRDARLPFASIVQCNWEGWWPTDKTNEVMAGAYRAAGKVFCVSHRNLELLEHQVGEPLPNGKVIWNPFIVPADLPPAWPKENGVWKLACVARLEPAAKGQDLLLQVLAQPKWRERPLEVNLFGKGSCEQNLKKLANRLQLKNIYFRGHVADVRQIWQENHLLVLPSRYEGLPLVLVEAMCCARPAVVTDIGGNAEICADGKTGFVAAAPALRFLEEALERAWHRRDDWQNMGKLARDRVDQIIPKDPVGDFCKQLTELAGEK